ncbi:MAG: hypothetical protein WBC25_00880 [Candidatus Acidiferrum sp.]
MYDDDEIRKSQEEAQRTPGQRSKTPKIDKILLGDARRAFSRGTEREFMQALRKIGISDESPKFAELVKLFCENRGPSRA